MVKAVLGLAQAQIRDTQLEGWPNHAGVREPVAFHEVRERFVRPAQPEGVPADGKMQPRSLGCGCVRRQAGEQVPIALSEQIPDVGILGCAPDPDSVQFGNHPIVALPCCGDASHEFPVINRVVALTLGRADREYAAGQQEPSGLGRAKEAYAT